MARGANCTVRNPGKMVLGVLKYGGYDGDRYEPIREAGDGESNTRDTEPRRKALKIDIQHRVHVRAQCIP